MPKVFSQNYQRYNAISGGQSPSLGESRNSKQNLYHSKNVSNPIQSQGLAFNNVGGRTPGAKSPLNNRSQHTQDQHGQDPQDNIDIDVGNDDYDEETDEFANYSQ